MQQDNKERRIFALVGMAGSGKTEAIEHLQGKFSWPKVYFPESLFEELKERGLEATQENEQPLREELRAKEGMGVFAKRALPKIEKSLESSSVVLVESLYSWEEYKILKKAYPDAFKVIAIYASPALRFSRLKTRRIRPLKTYEEFQKRDWSEIENTDKGGPIAIADYTVTNEDTLVKLQENLDTVMEKEGLLQRVIEPLEDVA